jgi:uncharacterized spore protein YtfJ
MSENTDHFLERIVNKTLATVNTKIVFSEPIEKNGIIVITVSKIRYGYGFGSGAKPSSTAEKKHEGFGIGLGVLAQPIGYIKIKKDSVIFEPIPSPASLPALILASGIAGFLLLRAFSKLFK